MSSDEIQVFCVSEALSPVRSLSSFRQCPVKMGFFARSWFKSGELNPRGCISRVSLYLLFAPFRFYSTLSGKICEASDVRNNCWSCLGYKTVSEMTPMSLPDGLFSTVFAHAQFPTLGISL